MAAGYTTSYTETVGEIRIFTMTAVPLPLTLLSQEEKWKRDEFPLTATMMHVSVVNLAISVGV